MYRTLVYLAVAHNVHPLILYTLAKTWPTLVIRDQFKYRLLSFFHNQKRKGHCTKTRYIFYISGARIFLDLVQGGFQITVDRYPWDSHLPCELGHYSFIKRPKIARKPASLDQLSADLNRLLALPQWTLADLVNLY